MSIGIATQPGQFAAAAAGGGSLDLSYLVRAGDTANNTSYTFAGLTFGATDAARRIVVAISSRTTAGGSDPTVTVAGETATKIIGAWVATSTTTTAHLYIVDLPTGTSGDVVVTWGVTMLRCNVALYRVVGGLSTPTTDSATGATLADPAATLSIGAAAEFVGIGAGTTAIANPRFNGVTQDYSVDIEQFATNGAHGTPASPFTWSVDQNGEWAVVVVGF